MEQENNNTPGAIGYPGVINLDTIYPVTMNGAKIGKASIVKQGLLAQIECRSVFPKDGIYRIKLCCRGVTIELGVCVPVDGYFLIQKRIPLKKIPDGDILFIAYEQNSQKVIWTSGERKLYVSMLQSSKREVCGGKSRLIVED